jgi:branched-chain amino acid aminotransferase
MWCLVDSEWVPAERARVPVTDHGFLYGDACFEGVAVCEGRVLHLDEHVARLLLSARALRIAPPVGADELRALLLEAAARNGMADSPSGYLRPIISRGAGPLGVSWSDRLGPARLTIIPQGSERTVALSGPIPVFDAVVTRQRRADPHAVDPRVKSNNYLPSILAFLDARGRGADVAILCDERGHVSEGHAMNVFCLREGRLRTPPATSALEGITRRHVIETAQRLGHDCREEPFTPYDLVCAEEAFVTSSLDGLAALGSVDGTPLPAPGPVTQELREAYVARALADGVAVRATAAAPDGSRR